VPIESLGAVSYSPSIVTKLIWRYLVSFTIYSDLLVQNREIFIPHLYLAPSRRNFVKMFDADKTRMIGLPYGEKTMTYVKPFSSNTGTSRTDRQTDRIARSISRVSSWRAIKSREVMRQ